jgi:hypothetical protein
MGCGVKGPAQRKQIYKKKKLFLQEREVLGTLAAIFDWI